MSEQKTVPMSTVIAGGLVLVMLAGGGGSIATAAGEVSFQTLDPMLVGMFGGLALVALGVVALSWLVVQAGRAAGAWAHHAIELVRELIEERGKERDARIEAYAARLDHTTEEVHVSRAMLGDLADRVGQNADQVSRVAGAVEQQQHQIAQLQDARAADVQHVVINSGNVAQLAGALNKLAAGAGVAPVALTPTPGK
jgi:hypothetical protein